MDKKEKINLEELADIFKKGFQQCPSADDLFTYMEGGHTEPNVDFHIKFCPLCRKEYEFIKSEFGHLGIQVDSKSSDLQQKKIRRDLAYEFVKKYFSAELDLFDMTWRIFKDFKTRDFKQQSVAGALGLAGKEGTDIQTPKIITVLNNVNIESEKLTEKQIAENVSKVGAQVGCSQSLIDKLTNFLIEEWPE